ncbi:chlorophyll A-B binding protein [Aureococcus anophagefferens]|nr:chlorophyll A-B binding protein [Aureococcus anophagefferens]
MKLALALVLAPAAAFQAPVAQKASVVVKDSIGVDPGPIEPSGLFWEDKESLARRRAVEIKHGRISMMAFLGMMIEDPTARTRALTCELQNGRAAMMGVTGAMMHSQLDSCDHHFFYPITHN